MSESTEAKSTRRFLSIASKYEWNYRTSIFFKDSYQEEDVVENSRYLLRVLPKLKKRIKESNSDIPIFLRLQMMDNKEGKRQVFIALWSPSPLYIPMFKEYKEKHRIGVLKITKTEQYTLHLKYMNNEKRFQQTMEGILNNERHLHEIDDFIYSKEELALLIDGEIIPPPENRVNKISQWTVINSKYLSEYERDTPIKFKRKKKNEQHKRNQ